MTADRVARTVALLILMAAEVEICGKGRKKMPTFTVLIQ